MKRLRSAAKAFSLLVGVAAIPVLTAGHASAQTITRGPYLQMPGPDQMLVVWHTDLALTDPDVLYGTSVALGSQSVGTSAPDTSGGFKHTVQLSGLLADTKYFYAVGSAAGSLTAAGPDHAFATSPVPGTRRPIRIWTYGDSGYWPGRLGTEYLDTRQAYYDDVAGGDANSAADATDVMLFLGDNAYVLGNEATYQSVFFGPPELQAWLRRQPFFSAVGNHEGFVNNTVAETGAYYDLFHFPTGNELGSNGVASGSESYYSFDYGNIHFVVLDTEDHIEQIPGAGDAMLTWLDQDLLATTADWIIAAWHRPPYSKGLFHDSDDEQNEIDSREIFVPILEDYGVDLVLNGHSHTYERTYLLDGHHGLSPTLAPQHILDAGDGDPLGSGAYRKASKGQAANEGAVYVVNGAAADVRTLVPPEGHPAMARSLVSLGTSVIDVDGDVLTGRFLDDQGATLDTFQIRKGAALQEASGRILRIKDSLDDPGRRTLLVMSQDDAVSAPAAGLTGDPGIDGMTVRVYNDGTGERTEMELPAAGWMPRSRGFRYRDKTQALGPCTHAILRDGLFKARCSGAGVAFTLDESSQGTLRVEAEAGSNTLVCMEFGGRISRDTGTGLHSRGIGRFIATSAPAPATCGN